MDIDTQSSASVVYANITLDCFDNYYVEEIQRHSIMPMKILSLQNRAVLSKFFLLYFLPSSLSHFLPPTHLLQLPPILLFYELLYVKYCLMHWSSKSFPFLHSHIEENNKLAQYGVILTIYQRDRELSLPRWIKITSPTGASWIWSSKWNMSWLLHDTWSSIFSSFGWVFILPRDFIDSHQDV